MNDTIIIKLSANENCYGCAPLAIEALQKKANDVYLYPEANPLALKEKLAEKFGVFTKNIVVGAGSVSIIDRLIQVFVGHDEEVLTFEKSFVAYELLAGFHNRKCHFAPLSDFRCTPENLLPFICEKTRLIFIANPNNPTGTIISHTELENFLAKIPSEIIVVIDEAYAEYVTDSAFPNSFELQKKHQNLVILRSFSKIYGLAGMRIGYAIMEDSLATKMSKRQIPFSLNFLASATAIAALEDTDFTTKSAQANAIQRDFLYDELKKLGYNATPSQANFIYLWFESNDEKKNVFDVLFQNGVVICDMRVFGQEKSLRITVGTEEICKSIVQYLS